MGKTVPGFHTTPPPRRRYPVSGGSLYLSVGSLEIETVPSLRNQVLFDIGYKEGAYDFRAGSILIRLTRRRSLQVSIWSDWAYNIARRTVRRRNEAVVGG